MRRPDDEHITQEEIAELGTLLLAERPRPSAAFAAELDARVAGRFERPRPARASASLRPRRLVLRWPTMPALGATAAVALVAVVVLTLQTDGGKPTGGASSSADHAAPPAAVQGGALMQEGAATSDTEALKSPAPSTAVQRLAHLSPGARKVERSATLALDAPADRVDDVAQSVLVVVAHADGIVDASSVSQNGDKDGAAQFTLRIPAGRLQGTLAELSKLPHAHVLSRSDDSVDVNQAYVSLRRRLADANAEHAGLLRALAAADTEDETLRLKARLDQVERTIALTERSQRGLNRRIDYSRVDLTVSSEQGNDGGGGSFTPGRALHDAGRVLAVTAGVIVIAAAALVPLLALLALGWPLARTLQRRRREQALDAG
ncbi:MAG TPA: DUF4349 domain-containing protein [Conexibacter sp.]|nr:DUF4349 domain-containing protein [Conexibacter sp.]